MPSNRLIAPVGIQKLAIVYIAIASTFVHAAPPAAGSNSAQTAAHPVAASAAPSYGLPPTELALQAIANLPAVQQARLAWQGAQASGRVLQAGPHEWVARAGATQHRQFSNTTTGRTWQTDVALERGIRWGNKAALDERLSTAGVSVAESAYEDIWHESARELLKAWFDWARAEAAVQEAEAQRQVAAEQVSVAEKRRRAGDAAALDVLLAQSDLDRTRAQLTTAQAERSLQQTQLRLRYPALWPVAADGWVKSASSQHSDANSSAASRTLVDDILRHNHEIELAEAHQQLAELRLARAESERRGDPVVGIQLGREAGSPDAYQRRSVGVGVSIPLGGAARSARADVARVELDQASTHLQAVRERVRLQAEQVAINAHQLSRVARDLAAAAALAQKSASLAQRAYAEGETPLSAALQARRQASEAQSAATMAQLAASEAAARAELDAHRLWPPQPIGGAPGHQHP